MKKKSLLTLLILNMFLSSFLGACGESGNHFENSPENNSAEALDVPTQEFTYMTDVSSDLDSTSLMDSLGADNLSTDNLPADALLDDAHPSDTPKLTLLMVGDILLHTPVENHSVQPDGSYNFDAIFANTKDRIQAADFAIVNQEVIMGGTELGISGYPAFNAPYEIGDALVDAGFDVVCHATNHALDKGKRGILNCSAYWEDTYPKMNVLGIHKEAPVDLDSRITILEEDDIRVAILNYTYGTNGIAQPDGMPYAVDLLEETKVVEEIQRAEELADFTIVCPHWGTEYRLTPDSMQNKWTKIFAENGVDLVLGTHPHVIEPVAMVQDEATGHEMLVYYSLGNFVNWTSGTGEGVANRMVGGMAEITLTRDNNDNVVISNYNVEALVCHVEDCTNGVTVYPLAEYTEDLANQNAIKTQDANFSLQYCIDLCNQVWGDGWH